MSEQERISWISLIVDLAIGWWYFGHVFALPAGTDLFGAGTAKFAVNMIILSVLVGIGAEALLKRAHKRAQGRPDATTQDERDVLIALRASRHAFVVLAISVVAILGQVTMIELKSRHLAQSGRTMPQAGTVFGQIASGPLSVPLLAHLLLLALLLSGIALFISRIVQYRRGY